MDPGFRRGDEGGNEFDFFVIPAFAGMTEETDFFSPRHSGESRNPSSL